ncbi:hypothetical protein [Ammoniphilus sp. 3BR4]|uniref:hypothetical protein n=1 Tax=Ammoniphilus sp. 3BR4 TaxID=3158265 RepID=UPI003464F429
MRKPVFNNKVIPGLYNGQKCNCQIEFVNGDYVVYNSGGNGSAISSLSDKQMLELLLTGELTYGKLQLYLDFKYF